MRRNVRKNGLAAGQNLSNAKCRGGALFTAVLLTATLLAPLAGAAADLKPVRRVLIVHGLGLASPAETLIDQEIVAQLENSPFHIELYREYLQENLFSSPDEQQEIGNSIVQRYRNRKLDVVIALGKHPLDFVVDVHERAFKDVPVVYGGGLLGQDDSVKLDSHYTGVWESYEPEKTLEVALRLQPTTRHVVVVGGKSDFDSELEERFHERLRSYESSLDIRYITDLAMPQLLDALSQLPPNTVVLQTHIGLDAAGTNFIGASQADPLVVEASNAPVFGPSDVDLGHGEIGGYLGSFALEGRKIGEMATRILSGESPGQIPVVREANVYKFDWQAMHRWGFSESNLPAGSIVLNRQPTVWEAYKWYIIGGTSLIVAEWLLISGLLWQRSQRRKVETHLQISNERLRLSLDVSRAVGWDWNLVTSENSWFGDLPDVFGIASETHQAKPGEFFEYVHPDDRERVSSAVEDARETRRPYAAEFRIVKRDGSVRWLSARGLFYYAQNGSPNRMIGMAKDVTERKASEAQLRESEERFRLLADTAPALIWTTDVDAGCDYVNRQWLEFRGRSLEQELGDGWMEGIHADDVELCSRSFRTAFDSRERFEMEYRVLRHDGEYRWIVDIGVPRSGLHGEFMGYVGSCLDVTERKMAANALMTFSGRLIKAQEEERSRIAREIHDDYQQRLAMVASELEVIAEQNGSGKELSDIRERICELTTDLHSLSHRLHSATLEHLGLVSGLSAFSQEFQEQQGLQVHFAHGEIPYNIPADVALCLFRVAQEAVRNSRKHSGADHADISLEFERGMLHLVVFDQGKGFDPLSLSPQAGIGVRSMEERLRLLGGRMEVHSNPSRGTRIDAWLPLQTAKSCQLEEPRG